MSIILQNIRAIRTRVGYSQEYMAVQLGMSLGNWNKIERGAIALDVNRLEQVAAILGCPLADLVLGPDHSQNRSGNPCEQQLAECRAELLLLQKKYIALLEQQKG